MRTYLTGADVAIDVLFDDGEDTLVPDVGSVTYTLYGHDGSVLDTGPVTTTTSTTEVAINLDAANLTAPEGLENRTLVVLYQTDGASRQIQIPFRLAAFVPIPVTADDARALIGVSRSELPDSEVDLLTAYYDVVDDQGTDVVSAALVAKDSSNRALARAICVMALLNLLPSFQQRILQAVKGNTAEKSRFSKIDFDALTAWLEDLYDQAAAVLTPVTVATFGLGTTAVLSTRATDPITNAAPA